MDDSVHMKKRERDTERGWVLSRRKRKGAGKEEWMVRRVTSGTRAFCVTVVRGIGGKCTTFWQ